MKAATILVCLLIVAGWLACQHEVPASSPPRAVLADHWVRTWRGWEPVPNWPPDGQPFHQSPLHPAVVAAGELLFSLWALMAFPAAAVPLSRDGQDGL